MTDRPILFSGPMVRALLASTKTQTRRDLTKTFARFPQLDGYETNGTLKQIEGRSVPCVEFVHSKLGLWDPETNPGGRSGWYVPLKAAVGDRLYVREHWRSRADLDRIPPREMMSGVAVWYEADGKGPATDLHMPGKHRQAMHMPRWASRLTLTVTDVRVERLQDISEQDCVAEGIEWVTRTSSGNFYRNFDAPDLPIMAYGAYRSLWNHINGSDAWDNNPWVIAYTFTVQRGNIDQIARSA
ncbi:hypothetical protein [Rhizobium ruizarguesonis]|uniref:hypothetical protein n=2 Tax=Rhizobium ruizarguesonis TaxID=2081791 RepID=UPI0010317FA1|nr:hypothetical protein [Rhizobium ruizarguesonis]TBF08683.1 hypothetical protein ELG96_08155 [Rhizobium ruizarguesonis]